VDFDAPAADVDSLDDEPEQALAAVEVKLVERGGDPLAESGEPVTQPVLGGQLGAACVEGVALVHELAVAGGQRASASGELAEVQQAGLVGVEQPGALALLGVNRGAQALELARDQLVLVGRSREHGAFAGEQLLRVQQRLADLPEHVLVQRVGADRAFRTEAVL